MKVNIFEVTSRNKKLLSNLEEIDLEIISLKSKFLCKRRNFNIKITKENLQLSLGVEIEETIETEDEEDVDLDLSLPEDEKMSIITTMNRNILIQHMNIMKTLILLIIPLIVV